MNNFKNLLILTLTALLGLSLFIQPAQSASTSNTAKAINYEHCLTLSAKLWNSVFPIDNAIDACAKYRP